MWWLWQIEWEDAHRLARRHMEREQGRKDATADMSSDLSEGEEKSTPADSMPRVESTLSLATSTAGETPSTPDNVGATPSDREKPAKRLYMVLIRCESLPEPA